jgi:hypothetical protein
MKNMGGIKILFVAALAIIILAGTCAAASLSNSFVSLAPAHVNIVATKKDLWTSIPQF